MNKDKLGDLICSISQLDVEKVEDKDIPEISKLWCETLMIFNVINSYNKIVTGIKSLSIGLNIANCGFLLSKRLYSQGLNHLDPLLCVMGLYSNFYEHSEDIPKFYPIKNHLLPPSCRKLINKKKIDIPSYGLLLFASLRAVSKFYQIDENFPGFSYIFNEAYENTITDQILLFAFNHMMGNAIELNLPLEDYPQNDICDNASLIHYHLRNYFLNLPESTNEIMNLNPNMFVKCLINPTNVDPTSPYIAILSSFFNQKSIDNSVYSSVLSRCNQFFKEFAQKNTTPDTYLNALMGTFESPDINQVFPHDFKDLLDKDLDEIVYVRLLVVFCLINSNDYSNEIVTEIYINSFSGTELKNQILFETGGKVKLIEKELVSNHIRGFFTDPKTRLSGLASFKNLLSDPDNHRILLSLIELSIKENDLVFFVGLQQEVPCFYDCLYSTYDISIQIDIAFKLLSHDLNLAITLLFKVFEKAQGDTAKRSALNKFMTKIVFMYPKEVLSLYQKIAISDNDAICFLREIEFNKNEYDINLMELVRYFLLRIPLYEIEDTNYNQQSINFLWPECTQNEVVSKSSLYSLNPIPDKCLIETDSSTLMFNCHTCGIVGEKRICKNCADYCHKSHDLSIAKGFSGCSCNDKCRINKGIAPNPVYAFPQELLIKLITNLSVSTVNMPMLNIETQENIDFSQFDFSKISLKEDKVKHTFSSIKRDMLSITERNEFFGSLPKDELKFQRYNSINPVILSAVVGSLMDFIVVLIDHMLYCYSIVDYVQIGNPYDLGMNGIHITVCSLDSSVFAIASLTSVVYLSISSEGTVDIISQVELMLEEISASLFINRISWVPLTALNLAVSCNGFFKVYDLPTDCFSPCSCYSFDDAVYMLSSVVFENNGEPYVAITLSNGLLAIQEISPTNGPLPLTRFQPTDEGISLCKVSFCDQSRLLLLCSETNLYLYTLNNINLNQKYSFVIPHTYGFLSFIHQEQNSLLFLNNLDSIVVSLTFRSESYSISSVVNLSSDIAPFSPITLNEKLGLISHNGSIYTIINKDTAQIEYEIEETGPYPVSSSFWTNSKKESDISLSIYDYDNKSYVKVNGLSISSPQSPHKRMIQVSLNQKSNENYIVGLSFSVASQSLPANQIQISFCGQRTIVKDSRIVTLAVPPSCISIPSLLTLSFSADVPFDIALSSIDAYSVSVKEFTPFERISSKVPPKNIIESITTIASYALFPGSLSISNEEFKNLIPYLYISSNISQASRVLLSKLIVTNDQKKIWAETLVQMIHNNQISNDKWASVWEDYNKFSNENRIIVQESLWQHAPITGIDSLIAAFTN